MNRRERLARAIFIASGLTFFDFDEDEAAAPRESAYAAADAVIADLKRTPHRIGQALGAIVTGLLSTVVILALVGCIIALARWIA